MKLFGWIKATVSHQSKAMRLYRRGMLKAKLHDHEAALAHYTAVIEMADAPANLRSMALYNRSLVYTAKEDNPKAIQDLETLLDMPAAAPNVKTEARRKLVRMDRTADRLEQRARDSDA